MADRPLFVVVLPLTVDTELKAKDAKAVGVYEITSDSKMSEGLAATSALETFKNTVSLEQPALLKIAVVDPAFKSVLQPDENSPAMDLPIRKVTSVVRNWLSEVVDEVPLPYEKSMTHKMLVVAVPKVPQAEIPLYDKSIPGVYVVYNIDHNMTVLEKAKSAVASFKASNEVKDLEGFDVFAFESVSETILPTNTDVEAKVFPCDKVTDGIQKSLLKAIDEYRASNQVPREQVRKRDEEENAPGL